MTSQTRRRADRHSWVGTNRQPPETARMARSIRQRLLTFGLGAALTLPVAATLVAPAASATTAMGTDASVHQASSSAAAGKKLCLGIPLSTVKPLFLDALNGPTAEKGGTTCEFTPANGDSQAATLFIIISPNDYGSTYEEYITNQTHHGLTGFGDKSAFAWSTGPPTFGAVKGNTSCVVTTQGSVGRTTLTYTMSDGNPVVTEADAAIYAKKMGGVCNAVFRGK
jgi:hypothetical protein